jgi:deoxyribodipyrimidine photo-lyase
MVAILWFRRDLRVHDHPALHAAADRHELVVPVFCLDDRLLYGRHSSGPRTTFLLECLNDLHGHLSSRGAGLVVRHGPPEAVLPALAKAAGAREVHVSRDDGPFGGRRDQVVRDALAAAGVTMHAHPGLSVVDDVRTIMTGQDRPYTVFTPFYRNWQRIPRRDPLAAPGRIAMPAGLRPGELPTLARLGLRQEVPEPAAGGESEGLARLDAFLAGPVRDYATGRDLAADCGSSRLSPYLRFGCLSPRSIEARLPGGEGAEAFRRQLCWRDFYHQVLLHHPGNARHEFQERYRGKLAWNRDEPGFTAWTQGRTGFPLVDAGMRQLLREGWMHNRVRLVVGSFLTKDLGIDWRLGEAWFMRFLIDGDQASNNGNWQWTASVGVDPQAPYRRIYNPALQRGRHDPAGRYVRAYVPELARVADRYLDEPGQMSAADQQRADCVIGRDYPAPIVDHRAARLDALARYQAVTG